MRNLKRALSLAVSTVMLIGMMAVGTSALSYADVTSEHNEEAIGVMQAVSVMVGDENGNFNPDKNVTRAEMAVVMANLLDLKVQDFVGASIPFTDVPEWARAYVAACYADGITGGISATEYGSNNSVTATQAALMMMKALGYFQYAQDFGTDWQVATIKQASKIELFDGIDSARNAAMTRNEVAQIALNALEATMVESDGTTTTITTGDITINTGDTKYENRLTSKYNYNGSDDGTLQLCENLYGNDLEKTSKPDSFGRPGTTWVYDGDDVAFGSKKPVAVYAGEDFDKDVVDDLTDDYDGLTNDKIVYNGGKDASVNLAKLQKGIKGYTIEVYADSDDEITAVVVTEPYVAEVTEVNTNDDDEVTDVVLTVYEAGYFITNDTYQTITIDAEDDKDAYALVKGYEEEDILMVTLTPGWDEATNMDKTLLAVDDVETVEGEVTTTSISGHYDGWVRIDGTRYDFANEYSQADVERGSDGVFYLYNGYLVHFDGDANKSDEYLYVARVGEDVDSWGDSSYTAEVVYADGTSEVIDVAEDYAVGVYTYEYDEDEEYYVLDEVSTESVTVDIEKGKTGIAADPKATGNSDTVYVAIDLKIDEDHDNKVTGIDDVDVYTGYRNVASMEGSAYIVKDGSVAEYVFVINGTTVGSADDLIYISGSSVSGLIDDADLGEYYTYDAVVNGEIVEIMVAKSAGNKLDGLYGSYSVDSDDVYSSLKPADEKDYESAAGDFKKADKGVITLGNAGTMAYADDAAVYVISEDGDIAEGSVNRNYSDVTILYTVNDDDEVVNVYIEK